MAHYEGVSRSARLGIARNSHGALRTAITHVWSTRPRGTRITHAHCARNIRTEHYPGGAMGTSRPTAITPAMPHGKFAGLLRTRNSRVSRGVRTARAPWCGPVACAPRVPHGAVPLRAHRACARCAVSWCGPVAVGRDVPIAPPRRMARCAAWHRAKFARGVRTAITHGHYARNIRTAHYPGGAMGTSRPTAITPGHATRKIRGTITHAKFANDAKRAEEHDHYARALHKQNSHAGYVRPLRRGGARGGRRGAKRARLRWGDSRFRWRKKRKIRP